MDSPYVRYAFRVLEGKYSNEVFNRLMEAVLPKRRKKSEVGMQGFDWGKCSFWEELYHLIAMSLSICLHKHLPAPTPRTIQCVWRKVLNLVLITSPLRRHAANAHQFPPELGEHSFKRVAGHLETLNYNDPVSLSCDNTKLFSTYQMYSDSEEQSYMLVGGVGPPMRVSDPEQVHDIIKHARLEKATKVSFINPCLLFAQRNGHYRFEFGVSQCLYRRFH